MRTQLKKFILVLLIVLPTAFCCKDEEQENVSPDFRLYYRFITDSLQPVIRNDTLVALIGYSGCNGDKTFEIQYVIEKSGDCTMWLHYTGQIEPCQAYFTQWIKLRVPSRALESTHIILVSRFDGNFILR